MPKRQPPPPPYTAEFRARMVELVRSGRSPTSLAKDFAPSAQTIAAWVKQADLDDGKRADGPDVERTRRACAPASREQGAARGARHPKKFAAWSVQEANRTPPKRSGS